MAERPSTSEGPPDPGRVPLFSGLNPAEKARLAKSAKYSLWKAGDVFAKQGEFTGQFHVVLTGVVSAFRTEPSGETRLLESLGPERWFGEVSALSNQPALGTLKAETPCLTLSIPADVFKALYGRPGSDFRRRIDESYRERGLLIHLRTVPLFRGLPEAELRALRKEVRFQSFATNQVVAAEGQEAEAVYLVRSGAVKCTRVTADGGEEILGYHMNNSSFGERCLAQGERAWRGTYVAMAPTDLLVVPREVLQRIPRDALASLRSTAELITAEESGQETGIFGSASAPAREHSAAELEFMVKRGSAKGGEALVIDLERCVRCNACVESCVAVHEDRVPRLSKKGNRVTFEEGATHHRYNLATSCYNCQVPGCMMSCNFGAIRRDVQGLIRFDYKNCVGCAMCVEACPYDVIRLTPPPASAASETRSFWQRLPLLDKLLPRTKPAAAPPAAPVNAQGVPVEAKAVKCDLCAGLPFQACVYNCPCSAIMRVNVKKLFEEQAARSQGTYSGTRT
jgi:CRP-like cAMP-binding protein/Na+-translocating ferredoxin:NAD+ oxidoreductase RNF subunit RnfB